MLLFVFIIGLIGSAVADDYDDPLIAERIKQIFSQATVDATAPTFTLIANNNYSVEIHHVTTDDGYILEMHRIPATPTNPAASGKPVAFLMHGLLGSSSEWVTLGTENALAYILADAGYDVWMGNARGTTYSEHHKTIISQEEYWKFSWHEIGIYDLPAMIDYTLEKTGERQLNYVGHSQGTTSFFVLMSRRTDYNAKIKSMVALAPVAYGGHLSSAVFRIAALAAEGLSLKGLINLFPFNELFPSPRLIRALRAAFCPADSFTQFLCSNILFLIGGFDKPQLNISMLPAIFGHTPAGASTRQLAHYGQGLISFKFREYDHGPIENLLVYGSLSPPDYDLSLITAPVHLFYSNNDGLSAAVDVAQLYNELGNPIEMYKVSNPDWTHFDYLWGIDAKKVVYDPLLTRLNKIRSN